MSNVYWFSPVLYDVITTEKLEYGWRLTSETNGNTATISRSSLETYKLTPVLESDLGLELLKVAGESRGLGETETKMIAIANAIDGEDWPTACLLSRTVNPGPEDLFARSKYLNKDRMKKIVAYSKEKRKND
jgi:hypothetical protein